MSDLIKRSAAIEHLKRWFHGKGWMVSDEDCKSILWDIPSVDRPSGEWIGERVGHSPGYTCSICGYGVYPWNNTNFCPNCGADMRERSRQ